MSNFTKLHAKYFFLLKLIFSAGCLSQLHQTDESISIDPIEAIKAIKAIGEFSLRMIFLLLFSTRFGLMKPLKTSRFELSRYNIEIAQTYEHYLMITYLTFSTTDISFIYSIDYIFDIFDMCDM